MPERSQASLLGLHISPSSGIPIYRQLMDQIIRLVASEILPVGSELPSVRNLAKQLTVNPMTISKAYSALEMQGVLTRVRGKGMIISENTSPQLDLTQRVEQLDNTIAKLALEARQLNVSKAQLLEYLDKKIPKN